MHATTIAVAAAFVIGVFASWTFIGAAAAVIFALVFIQKLLSGFFDGINDELGVEFITVPMILAGMIYGPMPAFLFGFFGLPFFECVRWAIKTPALSGGWPPIIPSPDVLVDAVAGAGGGGSARSAPPPLVLGGRGGGGRPRFFFFFLPEWWGGVFWAQKKKKKTCPPPAPTIA